MNRYINLNDHILSALEDTYWTLGMMANTKQYIVIDENDDEILYSVEFQMIMNRCGNKYEPCKTIFLDSRIDWQNDIIRLHMLEEI